ncbi:MAG: methylornithine synthase PylB [Desulfitobacterium hafniense]|nr:methylornithine synthase PylB [Desulfitobacterium hafniense]
MTSLTLESILLKACNQKPLTTPEILFLLKLEDQRQLETVYAVARELRAKFFKNKVFAYGFVYFSTWCRNDCTFCYYRKSNKLSKRYRKNEEEVLEAAGRLKESGVHLIDLTMGEDPLYHQTEEGMQNVVNIVKRVKRETFLPVMVSLGVLPESVLTVLASETADWYACYQETHNKKLFSLLRINQDYQERSASKKRALEAGMLIEEGILAGVGESWTDIAKSMQNMKDLGAHQVRVMNFVPQAGSTIFTRSSARQITELKIIAVLRLLFPDRLIPASLDVDGIDGLHARLNAGANVITSLIPPNLGLAGVAQCQKDINEGYRTIQGVLPHLEKIGMLLASSAEYSDWVGFERQKLAAAKQKQVIGGRL